MGSPLLLAVTSLLISSVIGGLPYGAKPLPTQQCYPKTVYVTIKKDIINEVPVPTRVYKTRLVPTRQDLDQVERIYKDRVVTNYGAELVTTTVQQPVIDYVTNYRYVTQTKVVPVVATVDKNVPVILTETEYSQVVSVQVNTDIVVVTDVVPDYRTTKEIVYKKIKNTKVIPIRETVYDTEVVYKDLCAKGYGGGYGYNDGDDYY